MSATVKTVVDGNIYLVKTGTRLSSVISVPLPCGGHGKCGKCKVKATGGLSPLSATERERLTSEEIEAGIRLACCTLITGECQVETLYKAVNQTVLTDSAKADFTLDPIFCRLGLAIDIGTTTLAAKLFDTEGKILAECGRANPQSTFGADVISRIEAAMAGKAKILAEVLIQALDGMVDELCAASGRHACDIDGVCVTGNTAMLCLLTETSPEPLSHAPFTLPRAFGETVTAKAIGFTRLSPETEIYLAPCISAFVGADTVCALLSSGICKNNKTAMMADIGTNGEMALWHRNSLLVCSTAAGPAFEGVGISMGMSGAPGAIDRVYYEDNRLVTHVVGELPPVGICGSGIVDAVAAMLESGDIDESGYLEDDPREILAPVSLTARDIRMVQLAKSAICAGLETLLREAGVCEDEVTCLFVAGGFGNYLNKQSAARIGLLPKTLSKRAESIGNAALSGAEMLLLDRSARQSAEKIVRTASTVELSSSPVFSEAYMMGMTFPEAQ